MKSFAPGFQKNVLGTVCLFIIVNICCIGAFAASFNAEIDAYYENSILNVEVLFESVPKEGEIIAVLINENTVVSAVRSPLESKAQIKFPENKTGDRVKLYLWKGIESMNPLSEPKEITLLGEKMIKTVFKTAQPGANSYAGALCVEDNFVYLCRQGMIYKLDITDYSNPFVAKLKNYSVGLKAKTATAIMINEDYIYVGNRLPSGGYPTEEEEENLTAGALAVLKKDDLSLVSVTPLGEKVSGMALYENMLIVNLQMLGWSIYDVKEPSKPVLLEKVEFPRGESIETQGGEIFEHKGKIYYAVAGFGDGIRMYDVTAFNQYIETPEMFEEVPRIGDDELLWYYHFCSHKLKRTHTYNLTVNYPYIYATITSMKSENDNPDSVQGILTFDITNVEKMPESHTLSLIANEDKNNMETDSDTQPSVICRIDDWLIINNDRKGIAYFDIRTTPEKPQYKGTYSPFEGSCVYRIVENNGKLFLTDGSGVKTTPKLYIVEGFR